MDKEQILSILERLHQLMSEDSFKTEEYFESNIEQIQAIASEEQFQALQTQISEYNFE